MWKFTYLRKDLLLPFSQRKSIFYAEVVFWMLLQHVAQNVRQSKPLHLRRLRSVQLMPYNPWAWQCRFHNPPYASYVVQVSVQPSFFSPLKHITFFVVHISVHSLAEYGTITNKTHTIATYNFAIKSLILTQCSIN